MALVRVRHNGREFNTGASHATAQGFEVLDEPTHGPDGTARPATRAKGRPVKPHTSVDQEAAEKKAAGSTFADQFTTEKKES